MSFNKIDDDETNLLIEIRKLIRAVDRHSKKIEEKYGITVAQLAILHEIAENRNMVETEISNQLNLSIKTTRELIDRLIRLGILLVDVNIEKLQIRRLKLSKKGKEILAQKPSLPQDILLKELKDIDEWQKNMLLTSFQRVNNLLDAEDFDAAPILATGDITEPEPTPETEINRILRPEKIDVDLFKIDTEQELEKYITADELAVYLRTHMEPFEDSHEYTKKGIIDALSGTPDKGGFVILAVHEKELLGALVMLSTGMEDYIPKYCLLFIGVNSSERGAGIGQQIIDYAIKICDGNIYLHVEDDNPAKRLYERMGFKHMYAEMRYYKDEVLT